MPPDNPDDAHSVVEFILADEAQQHAAPAAEPVENTHVFERRDFTEREPFYAHPSGFGLEVPGPGRLEDAVVIAEDPEFDVNIRTHTTTFLSDSFTNLQKIADSIEMASAFTRDGLNTLSARDIAFASYAVFEIRPRKKIAFNRVRGVWRLDEPR